MRTVQLVSNYPHGACSYYRTYGVFSKIKDIKCDPVDNISWQKMVFSDILFIERPQDSNFLEIITLAKEFGLKIWIDFDDDLFCLPNWNPGKIYFDNELNQRCMIESMELADVITVATSQIKKRYEKWNNNIKVVHNSFNDFNYKLSKIISNKKSIMWRGSTTHRGDILPYSSYIWELSKKYTEWEWNFLGNDLWYITDNIKNKVLTPELDSIKYFSRIKMINPSIYIAPLAFCDFNLAKSNCGWLEATYSGACTLGPDMPEWRKPGILNYKNEKDFKEKLELLINDEKLRENNFNKSLKFIKNNLLLSIVNKKREIIIEDLFK